MIDEKYRIELCPCLNYLLYVVTRLFVWDSSHLQKAFERSLAEFLPLLSMPSNISIGVVDYVIKIVGGALTFVLVGIALGRKFERKYTH
jgi:hypothetical protein